MGQKTNANVFRLDLKKNLWKSNFFEKNAEEFSLITYQVLEIEKFLKQFFKTNGLILHNCKIRLTESHLHVFISYYTAFRSLFLINHTNLKHNIKLLKKIKKNTEFLNTSSNKKKLRLKLIKYYKKELHCQNFKIKKTLDKNSFSRLLIKSLSFFVKKNTNIVLLFQALNKGFSLKLNKFQLKHFKKILLGLRKNAKHKFFKETINILLISIVKSKSAGLLSEYIGIQLEKLTKTKRHRFFLIFLKKTIAALINTNLSKVRGIKIIVTGRLNAAPRTKKQILSVGKIPLQELHF